MLSEQITNWAGNVVFAARRLHGPKSVAEVQEIVAAGGPIRVLGSGHSFNRLADTTGELISLAALPRLIEIAPDRRTVRVDGGIRYGELAVRLHAAGLALHNLASLPHISVAGSVATATHGSGVHNGNLATAVAAIEFIRGDGELVTLTRDDANFPGAVVALGALGVVTSLTLDVVPTFDLRQYVYEHVLQVQVNAHLAEMLADGYSVSLFTDFSSPNINQAWLKRQTPTPPPLVRCSARQWCAPPSARHAGRQLHRARWRRRTVAHSATAFSARIHA